MYCFGTAIADLNRRRITPNTSSPQDQTELDPLNFIENTEIERVTIRNLKKPILMKAVQLVNGKLDLVAAQLNTLNFTKNSHSENTIKNMIFFEKGIYFG
jgi:hypothetical protein